MRKVIIDKSILKKVDIYVALLDESLINTHFFIDELTYNDLEEMIEDKNTKYETKKNLEKLSRFLFDISKDNIEKLFNGGVSLDLVLPNKGSIISIKKTKKSESNYRSIDLYDSLNGNRYIYAINPNLLMKALRSNMNVIGLKEFSVKKGFRMSSDLTDEQNLAISEGNSFPGLMENEVISFGSKNYIFKRGEIKTLNLNKIEKGKIVPKNFEQKIAMYFLQDKEIKVLLLTGLFGTGKSFLTIYEFYRGYKKGIYEKLILTSSTLGIEDNGYRPGTEKDKVRGSLDSIRTTLLELKEIIGDTIFDKMISDFDADENKEQHGILKIMPLNDTQGQTYRNSLMFFDECQNGTEVQVLEFLSRAGRNSKVILGGNVAQAREGKNTSITKYNNGLLAIERRLRGEPMVATLYSNKAETRGDIPAMLVRVYNH